MNSRILSGGISALALVIGAGQALAQEAAPAANETTTEDVVVTATGRSERAFDVPLAMSVTTGEDLARANVTSLESVQKIEPALNVRQYGGAVSSFIIRGIVSQAAPTTGIYYGDAPLVGGHQTEGSGDSTPSLRLHDLNRVEVLKGPQGTLFGAGSMAGTIRAIPAAPQMDEFSGSVMGMGGVTDGGNPLYQGEFVLNVPVTSTFALRGVGWGEEGGGFIDQEIPDSSENGNLFGNYVGETHKDVNDIHVRGGRIMALWEPSPDFDLTGSYTAQNIDVDGASSAILFAPEYVNTQPTEAPFKDELELSSLTAHYRALGGTFMAALSYTDYFRLRIGDTTPTALDLGYTSPLAFVENVHNDATTMEFRYTSEWDGPFQLVTGLYYQKDHTHINGDVIATDGPSGQLPCTLIYECVAQGHLPYFVPPGGIPGGPPFDPANNVEAGTSVYVLERNHDVRQYAAYAQGEYAITDTLKATLGVRYFEAKLEDDVWLFQGLFSNGDYVPLEAGTQSKTSYNASLTWTPNDNLTIYGRAASGFRIGGLNDTFTAEFFFGVPECPLTNAGGGCVTGGYAPDTLWNYELGAKMALFDRRVMLDGAIFRIDWDNQQLHASDVTGAVDTTINANTTQVNGIELTARTLPFEGLSVDLGFTYVKAELAENLPDGVLQSGQLGYDGTAIPNQPEWSASLNAEYAREVMPNWQGYVGVSAVYKGDTTNRFALGDAGPLLNDPSDDTGVIPGLDIPASTIVGLTFGIRSDNTEIGIVADNITDEYTIYGIDEGVPGSLTGNEIFVGRPRTISLRVSQKF